MTQIWVLRSRLEKQPTDLRRRHHYMRDGTLAFATIPLDRSSLVSCPRNNMPFAGGQLAVFQGAIEAPVCESYGSSEQRGKTANWPRPGGLR